MKKIKFLEECIVLEGLLIIGDIHLGYEDELGRLDFLELQFREMIKKIETISQLLKKKNRTINKIILLGDLKHNFGEISFKEKNEVLRFLSFLEERFKEIGLKEIIIIRGNHDIILSSLLKTHTTEIIKLKDFEIIKDRGQEFLFFHGDSRDKQLFKQCLNRTKRKRILIIGHLHPSITLYDKYKKEKYKCFLHGFWKFERQEIEVYVVPSFSPLSYGYDLNNLNYEDVDFSLVPNEVLLSFEVIIPENNYDKYYNFGRLDKLIEKLKRIN